MKNEQVENYTNNEELKKVIYEFIKMRKKIKKPLTDYALELILKKLDKFDNKIEVLEQSIINSWQGIFEIKKEEKKTLLQQRQELYKRMEEKYKNDD